MQILSYSEWDRDYHDGYEGKNLEVTYHNLFQSTTLELPWRTEETKKNCKDGQ